MSAKPFLDLQHEDCRWPVSDGLFCADPISHQRYCAAHHAIAYVPSTRMPSSGKIADVLAGRDWILVKPRQSNPLSVTAYMAHNYGLIPRKERGL